MRVIVWPDTGMDIMQTVYLTTRYRFEQSPINNVLTARNRVSTHVSELKQMAGLKDKVVVITGKIYRDSLDVFSSITQLLHRKLVTIAICVIIDICLY